MQEAAATYRGLSRIHRPQTFADVLGQDAIVTTLKNALKHKKTAQAYLFCGTRGTGKTTLARVLAKALNCEALKEDMEPCNECPSCKEITLGKHLSVLEVDGASHRGIDDIRSLSETVCYGTSFGCKIFIIDEAHMLTKEAFNALLKTLEEPPIGVKFFLATTEPHKIPLTILSRLQRFDLQRIPSSLIANKLAKIAQLQGLSYEEEALFRIASLCDGSMRVAESLLDQVLCFHDGHLTEKAVAASLAVMPSEAFFQLDAAFAREDLCFAFTLAEEVFSSGKDLSYFFDCLLEHYRNLLSLHMGLSLPELSPSLLGKYTHSLSLYTEEQLHHILDTLLVFLSQASKSPFKRITLEMALLNLLKSKRRICPLDLVRRLEALQRNLPQDHSSKEPFQKTTPLAKDVSTASPIIQDLPLSPPVKEPPKEPLQKVLDSAKEISTIQNQPLASPTKEPPKETPLAAIKAPIEEPSPSTSSQARYETLMRFASIELEGTLTKEK